MKTLALLLVVAGTASARELTSETWAKETAGKTVFIKFLAPWCGHCKSMKPAWDKLMKKYEGSKTALVADVDCTAAGKALCEEVGVEGYPTIKWGDPASLEDYDGGREFKDFEKFAKENLVPLCSPANLDLCDDEKKAEISKLQAMSSDELDKLVEQKEEELKEASTTFDEEVEKLQKRYEELEKEKSKKTADVKASGLSLMKAVAGSKKSDKTDL